MMRKLVRSALSISAFAAILFIQSAATLGALAIVSNSTAPPFVFHDGSDVYHWRAEVIGRWNEDVVVFEYVLTLDQELKLDSVTTIKGKFQRRILGKSQEADIWYRRFEDILPEIEPLMIQQIKESMESTPAGLQAGGVYFLAKI